ncbi:sigma 54 modulation/S30EA ribosomal C-terminal domain-containing protein [Actinomadura scrupuli]|uniref:sigma 54 modulation/S30EA ribosomal C-terminal domain-containing protein n=1 Tax=Actinomadura scrupuli TaxID=559629 RepID=UPI003D976E69
MRVRSEGILDIEVLTSGPVPALEPARARTLISRLLEHTHEPVLEARIRLTVLDDPALPCPALTQINVDVNGRMVRAQAAAPTVHEAIALGRDRLRVRLERVARDWETVRGRTAPTVRSRLHGVRVDHRPSGSRTAAEHEVIRRKAYTLGRLTADDAVREMERLDYDFHLFTEATTGIDAVVLRAGCGYRLLMATPAPGPLGPFATSLTVGGAPAPELTLGEAVDRLDLAGERFVFFVDAGTGRGNLLYHRHDGRYGLIVPVT